LKHIKKYNESVDNINDKIDYIKLCFTEFIDDANFEVEIEYNQGEYYDDKKINGDSLALGINLPILPFKSNKKLTGISISAFEGSIEDYLKYSKSLYDFYLDIEVAIKRILDKYSDIEYVISKEPFEEQVDGKLLSYIWVEFKL